MRCGAVVVAAVAAASLSWAQPSQPSLEERAGALQGIEAKRRAEPELAEAVRKNPADAESLVLLAVVRESLGGSVAEVAGLYEGARTVLETKAAEQPAALAAAVELHARWAERNRVEGVDVKAARDRAAELRKSLTSRLSPPREAGAGEVLRIGDGVAAPRLASKREPEYSNLARLAYAEGTVVLGIVVEPSGRPTGMRLLRSLGLGLDERAMEAVRQWRFTPGTRAGGEAVPVQATVEVNFRLL